ncbi:hypothetical protein BD410DRAFT_783573 [Rickenella mellea]|uniref:Uncharacterized protein n=1 Tax=Rickenella mellea TaxID=50990 RepID=A0A4Y7QFS3_9AGAM|nr:hypothetical protein BD410DRAFT_783573 [Rickenella mellea]
MQLLEGIWHAIKSNLHFLFSDRIDVLSDDSFNLSESLHHSTSSNLFQSYEKL